MMNKWILIFIGGVGLLMAACAYEDVREYAQRECYKMSEPDRSYCLEGTQDDYRAYTEKREALTKPKR